MTINYIDGIGTVDTISIRINNEDIYSMRKEGEMWVIDFWNDYAGSVPAVMMFSDCSPRTAWKTFYHTVRREYWYRNGR